MRRGSTHCRSGIATALVVGAAMMMPAIAAADDNDDADEYQLDEILEEARQYAPLLAELDANEAHARAQQQRAERAWWPSLEATTTLAPVPADADPTRIDENLDEITSFNLGPYVRQTARATMPLYTFGRIDTARELADLGVDVADLERQEAMLEHLHRTRQAYYGRQLARAFGDLLDEGGAMIKDELEQMEEDRAFGEADFETEDLRRLQIFDAELDTMILDNNRLRDLTGAALSYLTDLDGPIEVPPLDPDDADRSLEDLATYQQLARAHRPEIQQLSRGVEARRLEEQLQQREFYPNVFGAVDFGFGWSTEDPALQQVCRRDGVEQPCVDVDNLYARPYQNPFDTLTFGVAVGLQWSLDFGQQYGRLQESQALRSEVEAQQDRALGALELEIEEAWREAYDARERIDIEQRRYDAARRWRNQYGLQEELGRDDQDMEDLIDPLREYYEARVSYLEAAHNYLAARAELAQKVGVEELSAVDDEVADNSGFLDRTRPSSE